MINFENINNIEIKILDFEEVYSSLNKWLDRLWFYINWNPVNETPILDFFYKIYNFYNDNLSIFWIIFSILFLINSIWLFFVSKKIWEENSFLAFFPILQIHTYIKVCKKTYSGYFFLPILLIILWLILTPYTLWASLAFALIISLALYIDLFQGLSRRIWKWFWVALWFSFLPFIFFPIFWKKL